MTSVPEVALDARRLQDRPLGGVGRYLAGLVPGLIARCDLTLLVDGRRPRPEGPAPIEALTLPRGLPETVWLHGPARRWARAHGAVFHGTFNALPFGLRRPGVVTIHDLSFEVHPEDFGVAKRQLFRLQARAAARAAQTVIVPSRFTADELRRQYGTPASRVTVIPLALGAGFGPTHAEALADLAPALSGRRYVVALGGAPRRGLEVALAAWRRVREAGFGVDLVVAGGDGARPEPGLHLLREPDDATWAAVLAGAAAFVYPTRYEGFGLPALEAAASGAPVVAARRASLPEVLGPAATWVEEPTVAQISEALRSVLGDASLHADLRAAGLERAAAQGSWDDAAAAHAAVYAAADRAEAP